MAVPILLYPTHPVLPRLQLATGFNISMGRQAISSPMARKAVIQLQCLHTFETAVVYAGPAVWISTWPTTSTSTCMCVAASTSLWQTVK